MKHPLERSSRSIGMIKKLKRGRGSQRHAKVLVMASESPVPVEVQKPHKKKSRFRFVKMKVLENLKGETIDKHIESFIDPSSTIITDGFKGYLKTKGKVAEHEKHIVPPKEASVVLPWVHILIANAKRVLLGTYHLMNTKHIQQYLNEFCYKANRWYDGEILFKRLLIATVSTTWKHLVHV